jgi:hypothetical protein
MATREYRKLKKVSDRIAALEKLWGTDKSVERKLIFFAVLFIVSGVFLAIQTLFESLAQRTDLTIAAALASISSGVLAWRYDSMNVEDRRRRTRSRSPRMTRMPSGVFFPIVRPAPPDPARSRPAPIA